MIVVQHVAHRQPELIQVVLDAQELQRIPAVSIDHLALEHAQARDLPVDVQRVGDDGRERQNETDKESRRGRAAVGHGRRVVEESLNSEF